MGTPRQKTCQRCGAAFGCGAVEGPNESKCWCMDQPYRMPMPPKEIRPGESQFTDCFCPACLSEVAAAAGLTRESGAGKGP